MPTSARRFENRAVRLYEAFPPIRFRGDVGIAPYAKGKVLPFNRARPKVLGVPSTPGPAGPPSPSRRGHGLARRFDEPVFPHPSRLTACHLKRGGRLPPGGGAFIGARSELSGVPPHPSGPLALPPSPEGKASSRWGFFYTRFVYPIRAWSTSLAQARPSVMAQTTRDWPRRQSPAAKILGFSVR